MTGLDASSVATLLALQADNSFRTKAYARAAENVLASSLPLEQVILQDRLREIRGVGDAIAEIIKKLHATGTHPTLEKMRRKIPAGVLEIGGPVMSRTAIPARQHRADLRRSALVHEEAWGQERGRDPRPPRTS